MSRTTPPSAPLWLMNAMLPGLSILSIKVALRLMLGRIMPRQLGPIIRKLYLVFISVILSSSALPSAPISLKPALIMIMPFMPVLPHCSRT